MELHVTTNVTWQMAKKTKGMEAGLSALNYGESCVSNGAKFEPLRVFCIEHWGKEKGDDGI